jgi:hypothetical protein
MRLGLGGNGSAGEPVPPNRLRMARAFASPRSAASWPWLVYRREQWRHAKCLAPAADTAYGTRVEAISSLPHWADEPPSQPA